MYMECEIGGGILKAGREGGRKEEGEALELTRFPFLPSFLP